MTDNDVVKKKSLATRQSRADSTTSTASETNAVASEQFFDEIAEVLLPVPLSKTFDYRLATDSTDKVRVGQRVLVEFGNGKSQVGLIMALRTDSQNTDSHTDKDNDNTDTDNPTHQLKTISSVLDDFPVVDKSWCELITFASRYYAEPLGKAYKNAFPKRLRMPEPIALPRSRYR